jgi:hypothetical protein
MKDNKNKGWISQKILNLYRILKMLNNVNQAKKNKINQKTT